MITSRHCTRWMIAFTISSLTIAITLFKHRGAHHHGSVHHHSPIVTSRPEVWTNRTLEPRSWLQAQDLNDFGSIPCRWVSVERIRLPLCVYNSNEDIVSAPVHRGKLFHQDLVEKMVRLFRRLIGSTHAPDDRVQLIDLGANIGSFSMPVSRLTSVLAVEPNFRTMTRLAMSVVLGNVDQNVTLVYSAVTNRTAILNLAYLRGNPGHTVMSTNEHCEGVRFTVRGLRCLRRPVWTMTLDDLVPLMKQRRAILKVDVEGDEVNVFTEETASVFFDKVDVPMIVMEWLYNVKRFQKNTQYAPVVERLVRFFYRRSYHVFDIDNRPLSSDWREWPLDILLKKDYFVNEMF